MTKKDNENQKRLTDDYRAAASSDAHHERGTNSLGKADSDATINVTPESPHEPMSDIAHPDPADGEDHAAPPSPLGPDHDKLMRGYEPGEMAGES